jgi:hypothetical protein
MGTCGANLIWDMPPSSCSRWRMGYARCRHLERSSGKTYNLRLVLTYYLLIGLVTG